MINGFAKSEDTYKDYSRVKEIRIDILEYDGNLDLQPTSKSKTVDAANFILLLINLLIIYTQ